MMTYVHNSINDADCIMYMCDASTFSIEKAIPQSIRIILEYVIKANKKIILLLNKLDLLSTPKEALPMIAELHATNLFTDIIPISALKCNNINTIIETITKYLPKSHFYYDPELLSTQPQRFFVSEIIRERIFMAYKEEIPYSTEINIVEFSRTCLVIFRIRS